MLVVALRDGLGADAAPRLLTGHVAKIGVSGVNVSTRRNPHHNVMSGTLLIDCWWLQALLATEDSVLLSVSLRTRNPHTLGMFPY